MRNHVKKILSMKVFWYIFPLLFCFAIAVGSDCLTISEALSVPQGKTYVFGHNYYTDFFTYLSVINEGIRGKFLISSRYTSQYYPPQFIQPFFTIAGFAGGLLGMTPQIIYWVSRILGGTFLLFFVYLAGKKLFGKYAVLSFITVLFSVPLWFINGGRVYQWGEFWTGFDPLYRITFLPHHLFANMFGFAALLCTDRAVRTKRMAIGVAALLCLTASIFINPAIALMYAVSILMTFGIYIVRGMSNMYTTLLFLCFIFVVGVSSGYSYSVYSSSPFWNSTAIERTLWYPIDGMRFLFVLGPMALIAGLSVLTIRKWTFFTTSLVILFFLPIIILFLFPYISPFLPIVIIRFVQSAPYIPTGLLATFGLIWLYRWAAKKHLILRILCIAGMVGMYMLAVPTFIASMSRIQTQFAFDLTHEPRFYISNDMRDVFSWLHTHAIPDETVLAVEPVSYMIASFTHLVTPVGPSITPNAEKLRESYKVFTFQTTPEIRAFLSRERISYLLVYTHQQPTPEFIRVFGFEKVYGNSQYVVYHRNLSSNQ